VAFGMLFPNTELMLMFFPVPIKAKYFVSMYVLWEIYRGISMSNGDNVAHFAHLGGALFGYILVKIWNKNRTTLY
jgi:membrane associated rhomboid family serine protease